ncbi:MAG: hypothetical protein ABJN36_04435 [Cyclobacteriaceae bacterium]
MFDSHFDIGHVFALIAIFISTFSLWYKTQISILSLRQSDKALKIAESTGRQYTRPSISVHRNALYLGGFKSIFSIQNRGQLKIEIKAIKVGLSHSVMNRKKIQYHLLYNQSTLIEAEYYAEDFKDIDEYDKKCELAMDLTILIQDELGRTYVYESYGKHAEGSVYELSREEFDIFLKRF